jgi:hypothetical protein
MILSTDIFRREKRDGRNPSTGAKTSEESIKEAELKKKKMKGASSNE